MASLSSIHTALISKMGTLFPNKTQINAMDLEDNPVQLMVDGWGLKISGGSPVEIESGPVDYVFATDREFMVYFTREVYDLQANLASYNSQANLIADDKDTLLNSLLDFGKVTGMLNGENIEYLGDGGIELLVSGKKRFIYMEVVFSFELTQVIN